MEKTNKKELQAAYKERKVIGGIYVIKNTSNEKMLLQSTADLQGSRNRYEFTRKIGSFTHLKLQEDWRELGSAAFQFEVLEELEKMETQTTREFADDLKTLFEIWFEKLDSEKLY